MMFCSFPIYKFLILILSTLIIIFSILSFHQERKTFSLFLLFLGSIGLGLFISLLDPFLILWDEQYHALVAKNLLNHPLKPVLFDDPRPGYDFRSWTSNHIWLHKQPLFLWQIALSLKFFGINELAVRIPDILMHALLPLMIYRIGKTIYGESTGFYGALFFTVAYFPLELIAGKFATDHNDFAFLFYVTSSFWSWFEYQQSQKKIWLLLIGLFAGCAVLVKWLVGLLIYAVWMITILFDKKEVRSTFDAYESLIISFIISLLVFLPWQIFTLLNFPQEAKYEFALNSRHFFEPVEGHTGSALFHIEAIKSLYGSGVAVPYILLLGLVILIWKTVTNQFRIAVVSAILITYGFYTLAATKMTAFCIIVSPFVFLALGSLTDVGFTLLLSKFKSVRWVNGIKLVGLVTICFFLINISRIRNYHTDWKPHDNCNRIGDLKQMDFIQKVKALPTGTKWKIYNSAIRVNGHIAVMFYTGYPAYDFIPDEKLIRRIKEEPGRIAIVDNGDLPGFIKEDKDIVIIKN